MQLPGCVWRLWLMSGSLCDELVLLSPVVSSVGSPTALQTAKAEEEEEEEEGCVCIVLSSNYLVILTSVFVAEANFANSFHLTLQSPVIWSSDKTGLQTSVTADCLRLLTLSTWTQTKPVLNCSVKNKSYLLIYFSFFLAVLSFFCVCVSLFCSSFVGYGRNLLHLICLIIKPLMFVACYFTDFLAVPCCCISVLPRSSQSTWLY